MPPPVAGPFRDPEDPKNDPQNRDEGVIGRFLEFVIFIGRQILVLAVLWIE